MYGLLYLSAFIIPILLGIIWYYIQEVKYYKELYNIARKKGFEVIEDKHHYKDLWKRAFSLLKKK